MDYNKLSKPEIINELEQMGIAYNSKKSKNELLDLLIDEITLKRREQSYSTKNKTAKKTQKEKFDLSLWCLRFLFVFLLIWAIILMVVGAPLVEFNIGHIKWKSIDDQWYIDNKMNYIKPFLTGLFLLLISYILILSLVGIYFYSNAKGKPLLGKTLLIEKSNEKKELKNRIFKEFEVNPKKSRALGISIIVMLSLTMIFIIMNIFVQQITQYIDDSNWWLDPYGYDSYFIGQYIFYYTTVLLLPISTTVLMIYAIEAKGVKLNRSIGMGALLIVFIALMISLEIMWKQADYFLERAQKIPEWDNMHSMLTYDRARWTDVNIVMTLICASAIGSLEGFWIIVPIISTIHNKKKLDETKKDKTKKQEKQK